MLIKMDSVLVACLRSPFCVLSRSFHDMDKNRHCAKQGLKSTQISLPNQLLFFWNTNSQSGACLGMRTPYWVNGKFKHDKNALNVCLTQARFQIFHRDFMSNVLKRKISFSNNFLFMCFRKLSMDLLFSY